MLAIPAGKTPAKIVDEDYDELEKGDIGFIDSYYTAGGTGVLDGLRSVLYAVFIRLSDGEIFSVDVDDLKAINPEDIEATEKQS